MGHAVISERLIGELFYGLHRKVSDKKLYTWNSCKATEGKGKSDRALRMVPPAYRPRATLICWMACGYFLKLNKKINFDL